MKSPTYKEFLDEGLGIRMGKNHKQLLKIAKDVLNEKFLKQVVSIEPSNHEMPTPSTVKGGQNNGWIEASQIELTTDTIVGNKNMRSITLSVRKRTSGPGSGYIGIRSNTTEWKVEEVRFWDHDELVEVFLKLWLEYKKEQKIRF